MGATTKGRLRWGADTWVSTGTFLVSDVALTSASLGLFSFSSSLSVLGFGSS